MSNVTVKSLIWKYDLRDYRVVFSFVCVTSATAAASAVTRRRAVGLARALPRFWFTLLFVTMYQIHLHS